ncbi:MAG: hypothetical protein FJ291_02685 [Planctomycetes bacterium]|nr:hypothetical protein [Planctomycetota bacterium]
MASGTGRRFRLRRVCVALALLPLVGGCATWTLDDATNRPEAFGGVVGAFVRDGELGVAHVAVGNRPRARVAWFNAQALREGTHPSTDDGCALPLRVEKSAEAIPRQARPVPVAQTEGSAPWDAAITVLYRPNDERGVARPRVLARLEADEGAAADRELHLPLGSCRAWQFYPLLPFAVVLDIVALPISVLFLPDIG